MNAARDAPLRVRRDDAGVLTVELDRPERMNALDASLVDALLAVVTAAHGDGTRMLVLRGNGRNFSAGFDLSGLESLSDGDLLLRFVRIEQLLQAVCYAPFETVALAHGRNFGAGVDLVCACARRIADPEATFRMPGLGFGLVLGTRRFARRVGPERARRILQESLTFGAHDGLEMGFCEHVAARERWPEIVAAIAASASRLAPEAASALYRCTSDDGAAGDLAELVQSASRPGLRARIERYRSGEKRS